MHTQTATLIYPHQLFAAHPALAPGRPVYLIEEPLILTENPIHRQKLVFHKLTMDSYEAKLSSDGYEVIRLSIHEYPRTSDVWARLVQDGVAEIHVADTTDDYLERALKDSGLTRMWYESPGFLLSKAEACERFQKSKRFMASFYKALRKDRNILMTEDGEPVGGQWSFDAENRQKVPKGTQVPSDPVFRTEPVIAEAAVWAETVPAEQYGEAGCWLPTDHVSAHTYLGAFLTERFASFGPYEDAMLVEHTRLWHSTVSPLINIGLLTPHEVLEAALKYAAEHEVPLPSLEGFVRQILGWREFIRASYETDGRAMRRQNFFNATRTLSATEWEGATGLLPFDTVAKRALTYGYTHHIERLMVAGNYFLLTGTHPAEVYRWFMGLYLDAYDWVMVPNVYGMSQFADGGSFATKPYLSGANYLRKMSDFPAGAWEATWTGLYWHFIATHEAVFANNHRLSMMPRTLARMNEATREAHHSSATVYLQTLQNQVR